MPNLLAETALSWILLLLIAGSICLTFLHALLS